MKMQNQQNQNPMTKRQRQENFDAVKNGPSMGPGEKENIQALIDSLPDDEPNNPLEQRAKDAGQKP